MGTIVFLRISAQTLGKNFAAFGRVARSHATAARDRRRECEGRVLSQLASFAIIEELSRRLGFPCIPTIKESDGGGEGRLFQEGACDMAAGIDWDTRSDMTA